MQFQVTVSSRKPVNNLEAHLIQVAQAMSKGKWGVLNGKGAVPIKNLEHFQNALQLERDIYCSQNRSIRVSSVAIRYLEDGSASEVWICPASNQGVPTATISLTAEGVDQKQIQDTLLIPVRT
ncbi:hypothetical protein GCM10028805_47250 [Spirosoma harenae]